MLGTEHIERLTKTVNDNFDVLNGRHIKEGITPNNWWINAHDEKVKGRKQILEAMLAVLAVTERIYEKDKNRKMFCSLTTVHGWRMTIRSVIALTEEMFNAGYTVVLTGKMNQDPVEVKRILIVIIISIAITQ